MSYSRRESNDRQDIPEQKRLCSPSSMPEDIKIKVEDGSENETVGSSRPGSEVSITTLDSRESVGWVMVDSIPVPYLVRNKHKYVSVKIVEETILRRYPSDYPDELRQHRMDSVYCTSAESKLLNDICANGEANTSPFTNKDVIVKLDDFVEFFNKLKSCYPDVGTADKTEAKSHTSSDPVEAPSDEKSHPMRCASPTWVQMNNALVPSLKFMDDIYLPLEVVRNAAKLLSDTNDFPPSKMCLLGQCTDMLNDLCKKSSILFTFEPSEQLVSLEYILKIIRPPPFWTELPKDNPIGNAVTVPVQRGRRGRQRSNPEKLVSENGLRGLLQLPKKSLISPHAITTIASPPKVTQATGHSPVRISQTEPTSVPQSPNKTVSTAPAVAPVMVSPPYFRPPVVLAQSEAKAPPLMVQNLMHYPGGPIQSPMMQPRLTDPVRPMLIPPTSRLPATSQYSVGRFLMPPAYPPPALRPTTEQPRLMMLPHVAATSATPPHTSSVHPGAPQEMKLKQLEERAQLSVQLSPNVVPPAVCVSESSTPTTDEQTRANRFKSLSANKVVVLGTIGTKQIPCLVFCSVDGSETIRRVAVFHIHAYLSEGTQYEVLVQMLHIENMNLYSAAPDSKLLLGLTEDRDQLVSLSDCRVFCDKLGYGRPQSKPVSSKDDEPPAPKRQRPNDINLNLSDDQTIPLIIGVGKEKESVSLYHTCNILFPVNLRSHVRRAVNKLFKKDEERFKVTKEIAKMLELPDGETILLNLPALRAKFPQLKALVSELQLRDEEVAILD